MATSIQRDWRSCSKCQGLFYAGFAAKGVCPAGGQHDASKSFAYVLQFNDVPKTNQGSWDACSKCQGLFFGGFPVKGVCPAGGAHDPSKSFPYSLIHDVPAASGLQVDWRSCKKCQGLFFGPFGGKCPVEGQHDATGSFNYGLGLDPVSADMQVFDAGPLPTDLPLGGSAHLSVRPNGDFVFGCYAHDSGFDNITYAVSAVLVSTAGVVFTFQHSGSVEGTVAGLPFGAPRRDDTFLQAPVGNNPTLQREWANMPGARFAASMVGSDVTLGSVEDWLAGALKSLLASLGTAAGGAIVALL
jgi:hypothetical protein